MKRVVVDIIFVIICFLLQTTVFQWWALANVSPNLLLVFVSSVGFMQGKNEGLLVGFFSGLLVDVCYGDLLGFYALIYMFVGYLNGFFQTIFYDEDLKLPMILITVSDLLYGVIVYFFLFALRNRTDFFYYLSRVIVPEVVYTVVVTIVLYRVILLVYRKLERIEKRGAGRGVR